MAGTVRCRVEKITAPNHLSHWQLGQLILKLSAESGRKMVAVFRQTGNLVIYSSLSDNCIKNATIFFLLRHQVKICSAI
jgi:hypothetical protein